MFSLYRSSVYSMFGLYRSSIYIQCSVYTGVRYIQCSVYTGVRYIQCSVYTGVRYIQCSVYTGLTTSIRSLNWQGTIRISQNMGHSITYLDSCNVHVTLLIDKTPNLKGIGIFFLFARPTCARNMMMKLELQGKFENYKL